LRIGHAAPTPRTPRRQPGDAGLPGPEPASAPVLSEEEAPSGSLA
jgi:hypothetical protein